MHSHTRPYADTRTHKPQMPAQSVAFELLHCRHLSRNTMWHNSCYLLVALAPGSAQAFENVHCHLASFQSLQRVPKLGCHLLSPLFLQPPLFNGTPPLVWLFGNNSLPPVAVSGAESAAGPAGRTQAVRPPHSPPPLPPPCALCAPWPSQAGESYVTGCYVIAADRVLLWSALLRNIIPCCCHKFPPH